MNDFLIFPVCVCVFLFLSSEKDVKTPRENPSPLICASVRCLLLPLWEFVQFIFCVCVFRVWMRRLYSLFRSLVRACKSGLMSLLLSLSLCVFRKTHVDAGSFQTPLFTFLWQRTQRDPINIPWNRRERCSACSACSAAANGGYANCGATLFEAIQWFYRWFYRMKLITELCFLNKRTSKV